MSSVWQWRPQEPACTQQPASLIRLDGEDARRVLHGQTSAAIALAEPGQWIPTCCISPTARLRALAEVLVDGAGSCWLVVTAGDGGLVHQALDRVLFPADRVRLGPVQQVWWLTAVPGQHETRPAACADAGGSWQALGPGLSWQLGAGAPGQGLIVADPATLPEAWARRRRLSAPEAERWRLQLGLPAWPAEINDDHNPFELGLAARVSLSKGCYTGQETLAKLASRDGVKQQLRRWHWAHQVGEHPPEPGQELRPANADAGAALRLGRITSMLELANGDRIGLALVRRQGLDQPQLRVGNEAAAATVNMSVPERFVAPPQGAG